MSPVEIGFECGLLPVTSGAFSWNAHNGDAWVADLVTDDFTFETGTAGHSVTRGDLF